VKWAAEVYGSWATWLQHLLPGCKVSYKSSILRIVNKIKEMKNEGDAENSMPGWAKLTDMLRASYTCTNVK